MTPAAELERVAGGIVIGPQGDIAIVNQCGTSWSLPKGHLEDGESDEVAALREIAEETGLRDLENRGLLATYERSAVDVDGSIDESRRKQIKLFLFVTPESRLEPEDPSNPEALWMAPEEVAATLTHPVDSAQLQALLPRIEGLRGEGVDAALAALAADVRRVLPDCPSEVIRSFAWCLRAPAAEAIARAELSLDKPYGENHILIGSGGYGLSLARLEPGASTSLHLHRRRREVFRVRAGVLTLTREDEVRRLGPGEQADSRPGQQHSLANAEAVPLETAEIFSPALLDDKVRVADRYGRALGSVTRDQ